MRRPRRLRRSSVATAVFAFVAFLAIDAGSAFANHVSCGQTITKSTTLDSDLLGCQGDGIVIGADNLTLNLNGHTIEGNNFNDGVNNEGHTGVVVRNGTIRTFYYGVAIYDATGNTVRNVTVDKASAGGVFVYDSNDNVVANNTVTESTSGIEITGFRNQVVNNSITGHGLGYGIYLAGADDSYVARNSATLEQYGAVLFGSDNNQVLRNTFTDNGTGIWLLGAEGADNNLLERNVTSLNAADGILVNFDSGGNVIRRSEANQNDDDGIDINNPFTTVTRSTANNNKDWGIEAVAGVTDGGGNSASGNGKAAQCLNVSCK